MTKTKNTKRALLMSVLSLLLCVSMLVGSTFAWFTDSVSSATNKIQAGNLDLGLELLDKDTKQWDSIENSTDPLFDYDKWEPGYTEVKVLKLVNKGNLALKWVAKFVSEYELTILSDVIDVYVCASEDELAYPASRNLDGYTRVGTVREFVNTLETAEDGTLLAGEDVFIGVALHMQESAGNDYQLLPLVKAPGVGFDIRFLATQYTYEKDSFDDQYDAKAENPMVKSVTLTEKVGGHEVTIVVPEGAPAYNYEPKVSGYTFTNKDSNAVLSFDLSLVDENGEPVEAGVECPVTIEMEHPFVNMENLQVLHNGEVIENAVYDKATRTVSFTTNGFSPFEIKYIDYVDPTFELEYTAEAEQYVIEKGMFFVNPVNFFCSAENADLVLDRKAVVDPDCIAVDFTKDGHKFYCVSERATSIIVGDADDGGSGYVFENGDYPITMINNNSLCASAVLTLNDYDHGTLYILPGTYKEQRRLDVYGSMDIVGLGDPEDIHLIKVGTTSTNSSHRHLINVSGGSGKPVTDHIQVTIRNLHLDATVGNGTGNAWQLKDNGAVQSIRRSKVKCYDLIIDDNSIAAFYVNAKNDVNGTIYPAYMYVENCVVNVNSAGTIVDNRSAGDAYFYYNNLFYANGTKEYTSTNSLIKHEAMRASDWWN